MTKSDENSDKNNLIKNKMMDQGLHRVMTQNDDKGWWHKVMTQIDDRSAGKSDDKKWWHKEMTWSKHKKWFYTLIKRKDDRSDEKTWLEM